jgi:hypothetical protein
MAGRGMTGSLSRLLVYDVRVAVGEIEDHGDRHIIAFTLTATSRVRIGQFPDRRSAMRAIEIHSPTPPGAA